MLGKARKRTATALISSRIFTILVTSAALVTSTGIGIDIAVIIAVAGTHPAISVPEVSVSKAPQSSPGSGAPAAVIPVITAVIAGIIAGIVSAKTEAVSTAA